MQYIYLIELTDMFEIIKKIQDYLIGTTACMLVQQNAPFE